MSGRDHEAAPMSDPDRSEPGWSDEPRWNEPGWDAYPQLDAQAAADPYHQAPTFELPRAIVVAGTVGGAGATTIAILLAAALSQEEQRKVLVLDVTPAGGDLATRVFGTVHAPGPSWQSWARDGAATAALDKQLGGSTFGVVVLGADGPASDTGPLLRAVVDAVTAEGWIVVVDAGSGALGSPALATAIRADAALVLAMPQRADGANRARWYFSGLAQQHGHAVVNDAVVAVTDQDGMHGHVFQAVSRGLDGKVADIIRIPLDPQLATGLGIVPNGLRETTNNAVGALIGALTGTRAANRKPAG